MTKKSDAPLRGEDAFREAKRVVSERNDAVHARSRDERAVRFAADADRRREADARERAQLPKQPTPR